MSDCIAAALLVASFYGGWVFLACLVFSAPPLPSVLIAAVVAIYIGVRCWCDDLDPAEDGHE